MIRVMCVDDHSVVRQGIAAFIQAEPDMQVVAFAGTGEEAVDQYREHRPDVVLMDLRLPGMTGFEAIRAIRRHHESARVVVLTMYHGDEDIYRAVEAGASGYLLKDTLADNLIQVIRDVYAGQARLPASAIAQLANRLREPPMTPREVEVMQLIAKGMRNKEIGATLGISEETVQAHIKSIFTKLHVHDRTAALTVAIRRGIVHVD